MTTTIKAFTFSGGERHLEITGFNGQYTHRIQSSDDLVDLILVSEALGEQFVGVGNLKIPYFPYARQDRRTSRNTAFSLKAVAKVINSLRWNSVTIYDPHSDVTPALLENVKVIEQHDIIENHFLDIPVGKVIVAPDAGAAKKAQKVAAIHGSKIIYSLKERNTLNGDVRLVALTGDVKGEDCLIVDDICDGGRTVIDLAIELKNRGAKTVRLYVTHGIFSKGLEVFNGIIDKIYTTDTFISKFHEDAPPILRISKICS